MYFRTRVQIPAPPPFDSPRFRAARSWPAASTSLPRGSLMAGRVNVAPARLARGPPRHAHHVEWCPERALGSRESKGHPVQDLPLTSHSKVALTEAVSSTLAWCRPNRLGMTAAVTRRCRIMSTSFSARISPTTSATRRTSKHASGGTTRDGAASTLQRGYPFTLSIRNLDKVSKLLCSANDKSSAGLVRRKRL
jgi:hypothetical protein